MRLTGLEPARRETLDPKSSASTNSATGAFATTILFLRLQNYNVFAKYANNRSKNLRYLYPRLISGLGRSDENDGNILQEFPCTEEPHDDDRGEHEEHGAENG